MPPLEPRLTGSAHLNLVNPETTTKNVTERDIDFVAKPTRNIIGLFPASQVIRGGKCVGLGINGKLEEVRLIRENRSIDR